jgi:hypothetical protein
MEWYWRKWDNKKGLNSPCAQRETRTPMPFRAPPPQDGVSTNFTSWAEVGDSAGVRTQDPLIKSQMLYRLSYRIKVLMNVPKFGNAKINSFFGMQHQLKTFFLVSLLFLGVSAPKLKAQDAATAVASSLESGDKAFEAGQFTQAMKIYEEVYGEGKFSEKMLYRLAFMHENLRGYPQAIYYLKKAAQEFGDKGSEGKIRQLMQRQGSTRFFTGDGLNDYLSFYRSWSWLFYGVFGLCILGLGVHYWMPSKNIQAWRQLAVVGVWAIFFLVGAVIFHRSFLIPKRAVLMENTAFYTEPGFSANHRLNAFSLGETLDIDDRKDVWLQVSAAGRQWWVPKWTVKEL